MEIRNLSDEDLIKHVTILAANERRATLDLLYSLMELDGRRLYLGQGYSSLFEFCRRKLKYSEGAAQRRILAARCLSENPELAALLLEGEVSLCTIATAAKSIQSEKTELSQIVGKSKREVEAIVANVVPRTKPREMAKAIVTAPRGKASPSGLPTPGKEPKEERYELKFSVTKEVYRKFQEVKARLSNALGSDLSLEAIFTRLVESELKEPAPRAAGMTGSRSRYIPCSVRREVYRRDGGQCSYVGPDETRCSERHYLHFDHITPFALGGSNDAQNIRLLCCRHNLFAADQVYGKEFMLRAKYAACAATGKSVPCDTSTLYRLTATADSEGPNLARRIGQST